MDTATISVISFVASFIAAFALVWFVGQARNRRRKRRHLRPTLTTRRPPIAGATWTCPECDQAVPVTIVPERIIVMRLDPTDVEAHLLQHQEAP